MTFNPKTLAPKILAITPKDSKSTLIGGQQSILLETGSSMFNFWFKKKLLGILFTENPETLFSFL